MTPEQVQTKLVVLRDNLDKLAAIPQTSYEDFVADFRNVDSALYRLQTSIQVLIDLSSYAAAQQGLGAPRSSADCLEKLEAAGLLPAGAAQQYVPVFGFRNRIVHLYDRVDTRVVYDILTKERSDLAALGRLLLAVLRI
jgi:uncharacterized protein YutE (UPF0331/DUF86 family)